MEATPNQSDWRRRAYENAKKSGRFGCGIIAAVGPERAAELWEIGREKRMEMIARDRKRLSLGLEPLSNLVKFASMTKKEIDLRHRMKKFGYYVFRGDPVIYYDRNTCRSKLREKTAEKLGVAVVHISSRVN